MKIVSFFSGAGGLDLGFKKAAKRNWTLLAINVRTNHIHVVICIGLKKPKDAFDRVEIQRYTPTSRGRIMAPRTFALG